MVIEPLAARDGASCRPRGDLPWPVLAGREGWDLDALCALPLPAGVEPPGAGEAPFGVDAAVAGFHGIRRLIRNGWRRIEWNADSLFCGRCQDFYLWLVLCSVNGGLTIVLCVGLCLVVLKCCIAQCRGQKEF